MISGEPAAAGSILEVEDSVAGTLICLGKAVEYQEEAKPPSPPPICGSTPKRTKES